MIVLSMPRPVIRVMLVKVCECSVIHDIIIIKVKQQKLKMPLGGTW